MKNDIAYDNIPMFDDYNDNDEKDSDSHELKSRNHLLSLASLPTTATTTTTTITTSSITSYFTTKVDLSTIANTTNALLGVSIFAMPWGFKQSGVLGGSLLIFIVAYLSFETSRVLLVAQRHLYLTTGTPSSYPEIAASFLGPIWSTVVQSATIISCIGGCIGYLIFLGETAGQLFSVPSEEAIIFLLVPLILFSWIRSFRELTIFTILGVASLILAIAAIIYDGSVRLEHLSDILDTPLFASFGNTMEFLGPTTFLFTIHYCILSMGAETLMEKEKSLEANKTMEEYREAVELMQYGDSDLDVLKTESTYLLSAMTNNNNGIGNNINSISDSSNGGSGGGGSSSSSGGGGGGINSSRTSSSSRRSGLQPSLTASSTTTSNPTLTQPPLTSQSSSSSNSTSNDRSIKAILVAYAISAIMIALLGSAGFAIYRHSEIVKDSSGRSQPGCLDKVCQNVILNLSPGPLRVVVGIALCVSIVLSYILILIPAREHIERIVLNVVMPQSESFETSIMNITRTVLVLFTAIVALTTPYFGSILGAVGGLTDALQSLVLPPIIYMKLRKAQMSLLEKSLYSMILVWGLGTIAYTILHALAVMY